MFNFLCCILHNSVFYLQDLLFFNHLAGSKCSVGALSVCLIDYLFLLLLWAMIWSWNTLASLWVLQRTSCLMMINCWCCFARTWTVECVKRHTRHLSSWSFKLAVVWHVIYAVWWDPGCLPSVTAMHQLLVLRLQLLTRHSHQPSSQKPLRSAAWKSWRSVPVYSGCWIYISAISQGYIWLSRTFCLLV